MTDLPSQEKMLTILADRAQKLLDDKSPKDAMRGRLLADIANLIDFSKSARSR